MIITPVTDKNFDQAVSVYRQAWTDSHVDICTPDFIRNRDYVGYLREKKQGLFLLTDREPVGIIRIYDHVLSDLYVHPHMQGMGYGKALLRIAIEQEQEISLTVLSTNERAIGLYLRNGFQFTGNDTYLREGLWEREMKFTEKNNG